jgi:hypothetical protein
MRGHKGCVHVARSGADDIGGSVWHLTLVPGDARGALSAEPDQWGAVVSKGGTSSKRRPSGRYCEA